MKLRVMSIKTSVAISLLAIVIFALVPYEIWDYLQTERRLTNALEIQADRKILRLKDNLVIPLWELDQDWIAKMIRVEMLDENAHGIQVSGEDQLFVAKVRDTDGQVIDAVNAIDGDFLVRDQDVMHDETKIGHVRLYLSKDQLRDELRREAIAAGLRTLALIILIVLFLEARLNQLVIKPLFSLLEVVKAIANGRYDIRFSERREDELGLLARGIAMMLQNLKLREAERDRANEALQQVNRKLEAELLERTKAQTALKDLNDSLEERIRARTADLEFSNNRLKEMGKVLEQAKDNAESANRAKSVFLANMTHELRTPMNAVLGFSRLMQADKNLTEDQREVLDIINRSGNHLLSLINQVLDMAKIESGRMILENAPFDLGNMIRDVIDMMRERAVSKGLHLYIDQGSSFPRLIDADAGKLRHILINLLGNAIKYTERGEVILRLNTQSKSENDPLILVCEVEDTGIGIAEQDLLRIFDAFVQVGTLTDQHGTGLGLVITKQYVELMGGQISVTSEPDKGSLFKVILPVSRVDDSALEMTVEVKDSDIIGLAPGQPAYKVLVVEDQADSRLLLKRLLASVGFIVYEAKNGREAVDAFRNYKPDFIWMDSRMPVMDGITATKTILAMPEAQHVKIAAVTASIYREEWQALLKAGVCAVVYKPYRNREIFDCMAEHLGVSYQYEEQAVQADSESLSQPELLDKLRQLPKEQADALHAAAEELDVEQCLDIVQQIEGKDGKLAAHLKALVGQFNFEAILKLLCDRGNQSG